MKIFVDYHSARKVQGVFDLKGKDRLDMMKEIFHLQRFDVEWKAHKSRQNTVGSTKGIIRI
jgi:hypothetical protein